MCARSGQDRKPSPHIEFFVSLEPVIERYVEAGLAAPAYAKRQGRRHFFHGLDVVEDGERVLRFSDAGRLSSVSETHPGIEVSQRLCRSFRFAPVDPAEPRSNEDRQDRRDVDDAGQRRRILPVTAADNLFRHASVPQ